MDYLDNPTEKNQNFYFMCYPMYSFRHCIDSHTIILLACVAPNSCVAKGPHDCSILNYALLDADVTSKLLIDDIISHLGRGIL